MTVVKQLLTGPDNETHDVARVLCVLVILVALGLTIYSVAKEGKFDMVAFGAGIAQILGATGAFIKLKEKSEPPPKEPPE